MLSTIPRFTPRASNLSTLKMWWAWSRICSLCWVDKTLAQGKPINLVYNRGYVAGFWRNIVDFELQNTNTLSISIFIAFVLLLKPENWAHCAIVPAS